MAKDKAGAAEIAPEQEEQGGAALFESRALELVERFGVEVESIGQGLRDLALELFKHRPKPWDAMLEEEQRGVARSIRLAVDEALAEACLLIAEGGQHSISARLEKFTGKGGKYQATIISQGGPELASELAKLDGKTVVLIDADARQYTAGPDIGTAPDQAPLEFDEEPLPAHDADGVIQEEDEEQSEGEAEVATAAEVEA